MAESIAVDRRPSTGIDPRTLRRLLGYMRPYRGQLTAVVACIIISALASVASSMFVETLIDDYITPLLGQADPVFIGLAEVLTVPAAPYLCGVAANYIYNRTMSVLAQKVLKNIRDEMYDHMQRLPIKYFDTHSHGEIMSLYTNDTDTLRQMISQSMAQLVSASCTVVAVFFCMLYISIWLTLIVAACMGIIMAMVRTFTAHSTASFAAQQQDLAALDGYIEEMVAGQKVVKVFNHEATCRQDFGRLNDKWAASSSQANVRGNSLMPVMNGLGYMMYIIVAVIGADLAISQVPNLGMTGFGTMTLGMIASFLTLTRSFTNPISMISNQLNSIITALAGAARIFALLDEPTESDDGYVRLVNVKTVAGRLNETDAHTDQWAWKHPHKADGSVTYTPLAGDIVMDHVDFGYEPGKTVLHDITLYAKPGQKVAFVGATGAGKTTITNLINRFYDIADGKIRYDGININKIRKADLRRSLGMVLQDVSLFSGTVMDNLRFGRPTATDEQCIAAARLANADGFIRMLPQGYQTVLKGDGSGLSQGQRQLLSIARAAVVDPPVMILDEATSSIDTHTEKLVQDGMDRLMKGRTTFVIAHRLSTVQNADVIMVLDHGVIIERGTHQDLLAKKGTYYQLYTGSFELE